MALSGCANIKTAGLDNQLYYTVAGDECGVNSKWYAFGISTQIRKVDCEAVKAMISGYNGN